MSWWAKRNFSFPRLWTRQRSALLLDSSEFDRARLRAVAGEGASAWLCVVPSLALNLTYDAREFTTLLRFWLGMPVLEGECACPWCDTAQGRLGFHPLMCKKSGLKVLRHNALRELFLKYCKMGGIEAVREAPGLLPNCSERPADVLLPSPLWIPRLVRETSRLAPPPCPFDLPLLC